MTSTFGSNNKSFNLPSGFIRSIQDGECLELKHYIICQTRLDPDKWRSAGFQVKTISKLYLDEAYWSADELPTRIGMIVDGRLVPSKEGKSGVLSYGPYAKLPAGIYSYSIEYVSNSPVKKIVGKWDIMGEGGTDSPHEILSGLLTGTDSQFKRITGKINVKDADNPLGIRSIYLGDGDLQLVGISIKKES